MTLFTLSQETEEDETLPESFYEPPSPRYILTSSAQRQCCLVKGSLPPWIISLISFVLWIRLSDRVCNPRGHEVRRFYLGPCALGPAGGLFESPKGIRIPRLSEAPWEVP